MDSVSAAQSELDQQLQDAKRQLMGTFLLGLMAACLAFFGQSALAQARPLFPVIDMAYGTWQGGFSLMLWVLAGAWLAAVIQQSVRCQDVSERLAYQRKMDSYYARRAKPKEEPEPEPARQAPKPRLRDDEPPRRRADKNARSNKFDY